MNWLQRPMTMPFLVRLKGSAAIGVAELAALAAAPVEVRMIDAQAAIIVDGSRSVRIHLLLDGWSARFKVLENGTRQIAALGVPGDVCNPEALHLDRNDCGTIALTRCTVASLGREHVRALHDRHASLRDAHARMMAVAGAIATQRTVCLGRRSARERLAHLLCELFVRLRAIGQVVERSGASGYTLPLTQAELADVLGLTAVHVNRTLQAMRADGIVQLKDRRLTIPDPARLARAGAFDGAYLHMGGDEAFARTDTGAAGRARATLVAA